MEEFTLEQKQAIAIAQAQRKRATAEAAPDAPAEATTEGPGGGMSFFNKALAQTFGAPVDLISAGLEKVGVQAPEGGAFGGSESIRRGLANIGAPTPDRDPEGYLENIGQVGGEVASMMIPIAKGAQVLSKGTGTAARVAQAMNKPMTSIPGALGAAGVEGGGVVGAGIARDVAKEQEVGSGAALGLEVAGGLLGGFAGSAPITRGIKAISARTFAPFSEAGSFERASMRAREIVDNPELAARNIEDLKGSTLQPSAKSQDPGLMQLEQTVAASDPALGTRMDKKTSDTIQGLVSQIRESGTVTGTKNFLKSRRTRLKKAIDARVEIAGEEARKAIEDMGDVATEADISIKQRESLESALADARVQEDLIWQAVPDEAKVPTGGVRNQYKKLSRELSQAQSDDMPAEAKKLLGGEDSAVQVESGVVGLDGQPIMVDDILTNRRGFSNVETIRELDGLYKRLGETARQARQASQNNKARIAESLREAILVDMGKVKGGAKDSVDAARAFSKDLNEKFSNGTVGKILGTAKGSKGIDPELTLGAGVGQGGIKGQLATREIAKATGEDISQLSSVQEFIKRRFLDATMEDGRINPTKARSYIDSNAELLDTYPQLRDQFNSARTAEDVNRRLTKSADALRKRLDQSSVSATAKLLNAPVDQEMKAIFKSANPDQAMQGIVNAARKDKSGEAMKGLRAGVSEYLIDDMTSASKFDIGNQKAVLGSKLKSQLTNENTRAAMSKVFSKREMANWDKVADQLVIAQRQSAKGGRPLDYIINDRSSFILNTVARIGGARIGSKLAAGSGAGGSIQSAGIGSKFAKDMMKKLTADKAKQLLIDAVTTDEELLVRLLQPRSKANDVKLGRTLNKYMINNGRRLFEEDEEQPSQAAQAPR